MTIDVWLLYLGTVLILMITPGPSHLLMLSTSASNGFKRSLATAAGDLTANTVQIVLASLGLAAVLSTTAYGFSLVRWVGVAYLVYLGIRQILASFEPSGTALTFKPARRRTLFMRGFVTSAANPKAVVFFAALFPQFLNTDHALLPQVASLGVTYILVDGCFLAAYGGASSWLASRFRGRNQKIIQRFAGCGLITAAILLGLRSGVIESDT